MNKFWYTLRVVNRVSGKVLCHKKLEVNREFANNGASKSDIIRLALLTCKLHPKYSNMDVYDIFVTVRFMEWRSEDLL